MVISFIVLVKVAVVLLAFGVACVSAGGSLGGGYGYGGGVRVGMRNNGIPFGGGVALLILGSLYFTSFNAFNVNFFEKKPFYILIR